MIVCATGHRPHYKVDYLQPKKRLAHFFELNKPNIEYVISGMANGWDTIVSRSSQYYKIPLKCFIPVRGQRATSEYYEAALAYAFDVVYTADSYYESVYLDRDEQMVNESDLVLACWDPAVKKGGTYYTIKYAIEKGKLVTNLY